KEALDYYKTIRQDIPEALPFWPLGLPGHKDDWVSLGLRADSRIYLAVWRLGGDSTQVLLPLPGLQDQELEVRCAYPAEHDCSWKWSAREALLNVRMPGANTARLFEIHIKTP
ncbi:alpha-galactosidase, partial [Paenibacillus sepulcri]|nr:alpha-galactosidase [Paenibacillus sepulcri]